MEILARLSREHADARCALVHRNPYELLVTTILSAQCTDEMVNRISPALFARYPDAPALAAAEADDLMAIIRPTGFFRAKASSLMRAARALVERHEGEVPHEMAALVALPGVGRKTANIVRGNAFGLPGMGVDTHVMRLSRRMGLTRSEDPAQIEGDLCALWPPEAWTMATHYLIFHGRRVCDARAPRCGECAVRDLCPSARTRATAAARPRSRRTAERPRATSPRRSSR